MEGLQVRRTRLFRTYSCFTKAGDVSLAVLVEGAVLKNGDATRKVGGALAIPGSPAFRIVQ